MLRKASNRTRAGRIWIALKRCYRAPSYRYLNNASYAVKRSEMARRARTQTRAGHIKTASCRPRRRGLCAQTLCPVFFVLFAIRLYSQAEHKFSQTWAWPTAHVLPILFASSVFSRFLYLRILWYGISAVNRSTDSAAITFQLSLCLLHYGAARSRHAQVVQSICLEAYLALYQVVAV